MTPTEHVGRCREAIAAIRHALETPDAKGIPFASRFVLLSSAIAQQAAGTSGAGLSASIQQEHLFRDMLMDADARFTHVPSGGPRDADYCFSGYPLSHKTIGYTGSGDLALAWSKNPTGGLVRDEFESSVTILNLRQPSPEGRWRGIAQGAYVIPVTYLREHVTFSSNNKTDSLVKADQVILALRHAASEGLLAPIAYRHDAGAGIRLSLWRAGVPGFVDPRS